MKLIYDLPSWWSRSGRILVEQGSRAIVYRLRAFKLKLPSNQVSGSRLFLVCWIQDGCTNVYLDMALVWALGFAMPILGQIRWCVESWFYITWFIPSLTMDSGYIPVASMTSLLAVPLRNLSACLVVFGPHIQVPATAIQNVDISWPMSIFFSFPRSSFEPKGQVRLQYLR